MWFTSYNQWYHSGIVAQRYIISDITLESWIWNKIQSLVTSIIQVLPLVCMPSWLSVVTITLHLTFLLVCVVLDSSRRDESQSVCLYAVPVWASRPWHLLPHLQGDCLPSCSQTESRSHPCNQSNPGICLVNIQPRPSDWDAEGAGASGPWQPASPNTLESGFHPYITFCYNNPQYHTLSLLYHTFLMPYYTYLLARVYHRKITLYSRKSTLLHDPKIGQTAI